MFIGTYRQTPSSIDDCTVQFNAMYWLSPRKAWLSLCRSRRRVPMLMRMSGQFLRSPGVYTFTEARRARPPRPSALGSIFSLFCISSDVYR
ncbi:hypothetical protein BD311DRAFT_441941 [Dichomitus squalens]|uniref:Uncharacterized protein n=1 Tax=Dichomitus squalens TaxID=114155 RepID=A0A4Q9N179_9APHY|nr:hypothetical protein BD311DRAFT_441941 [Dichomitus squalens]